MVKEAKVLELWNGSTWDLRLRRGIFDREMSSWIGMLSLLSQTILYDNEDTVQWNLEGSGIFLVKSALSVLHQRRRLLEEDLCIQIWEGPVPKRVKFFL